MALIPRRSSVLGSMSLGLSGLGWPYLPTAITAFVNAPVGEFVSDTQANSTFHNQATVTADVGEFVCQATAATYRAYRATVDTPIGEFVCHSTANVTTANVQASVNATIGEFLAAASAVTYPPDSGTGGSGSGGGLGGIGYRPEEIEVYLHIVGGGFNRVNVDRAMDPALPDMADESREMEGNDINAEPYTAVHVALQCGWTLALDVTTEKWLRMPAASVIVMGERRKKVVV